MPSGQTQSPTGSRNKKKTSKHKKLEPKEYLAVLQEPREMARIAMMLRALVARLLASELALFLGTPRSLWRALVGGCSLDNDLEAVVDLSQPLDATVGGTTTVNWTSSFRTPDPTLAHWAEAHGVKGLDSDDAWGRTALTTIERSVIIVPPCSANFQDAPRRAGPKAQAACGPQGHAVAKCKPPRWQQTSMGARPQPHAAPNPKPARLWCNVNRPPRALQKHRPPVGPHTLRARAHCEKNQKKFKHGLR